MTIRLNPVPECSGECRSCGLNSDECQPGIYCKESGKWLCEDCGVDMPIEEINRCIR